MSDRLKKQMDFLLEIDKVKNVMRQTYLSDGERKENDAEHSWHLAVMCMILSEYSNEDIDVLKTIMMVLIHDIIEIYSGDTYAYDEEGNKTKKEREEAAALKIFGMLPEDQREKISALWHEFETKDTPEARFADTLDHIQPLMLNNASDGKSWLEHGIKLSQVINRNKSTCNGSETLWNYGLYNNIYPNLLKGSLYNDTDDIDLLRYDLAMKRICSIKDELSEIPQIYRSYFEEMTLVFEAYNRCIMWITQKSKENMAPFYKWYKTVSLEELQKINKSVNDFRYDSDYYKESYANPDNCVNKFGKNMGRMMAYLAAKIISLGSLCFETDYYEIIITAELFLEIYSIIKDNDNHMEGSIKSVINYHEYDYMEENYSRRVKKSLDPEYRFFKDILINMDLNDERSLYLYGENISLNEIQTFRHIMTLDETEINKIAYAFVNGYIMSFKNSGIDLAGKKTVQIRYPVGFERVICAAVKMFADNGLDSIILRNSVSRTGVAALQSGCIDTNPQFAFDHKFDKAIYYNKALNDRMLVSVEQAYAKVADKADVYAGPAVFEYFGEKKFEPEFKDTASSLNETQQKLQVEYSIQATNIINRYLKRETCSFTIIAFPLPEIGEDYIEIFNECIKINTLDTELFERIQTNIIDAIDGNEKIYIKGMNGNETDLYISLKKISDKNKETVFHNCLADCNIPVGEVYTSPVLAKTNGLLNVKKVYINGLEYVNLKIAFSNGMTEKYSCDNYDNQKLNEKYIRDNLMHQHDSLPMGEFAIGTNTVAYKVSRKYNIADKLPILIAEKTGPHIAIGDTCFHMSEDIAVFNPDGKEMIAKDNEISLQRKTDINKAYFGCHTDITIPYDELGRLSAIDSDNNETLIIKDGKFVLEGTEELNNLK